jgi:hypothetical protein
LFHDARRSSPFRVFACRASSSVSASP